jgi:hypothetical protein
MFIVVSFFSFQNLRRSFLFKLVMFMSASDIFGAGISNFLMDPHKESIKCYVQLTLFSIFGLASVLWSFVICFCLYQSAVAGVPPEALRRFEIKFHVFVWVSQSFFKAISFHIFKGLVSAIIFVALCD